MQIKSKKVIKLYNSNNFIHNYVEKALRAQWNVITSMVEACISGHLQLYKTKYVPMSKATILQFLSIN